MNKPSIEYFLVIILLAVLSICLLLASGHAIQITLGEPTPISNFTDYNNNCSSGWNIEGYFVPLESDYDGMEYAQTITIHNLDDMNKTITSTLNSEFLEKVRMEGWGLTKQGDYIGSWDGRFWGPFTPSLPPLGYPLVVGITSATDKSIIPYGEIFTIPTLPSPWNTKIFMSLNSQSDVAGKQVNIYTGFGRSAENNKERIEGIENTVCIHKPAPTQAFTLTSSNISIGDPVYDQFDSYIINAANDYGITDKVIVKSVIMQESDFDMFGVSLDTPCGVPSGWTDYESRSFGLMQFTPACGEAGGNKPNLTTEKNSSNWATSSFNPEYNINEGVKSISDILSLMKSRFAECSDEQYILMAVGAYNSGEGAIYGCGLWDDRAGMYIDNVSEGHKILSQIANILHSY
jgi:Transglycosylase SLT domain